MPNRRPVGATTMYSTGMIAQIACLAEVTARKPGNVHRFYDFSELEYFEFLLSAAAIAPCLDCAVEQPVGRTVLAAIQATRRVVASNTNLGIVLLLAPLAAVARDEPLAVGVKRVLAKVSRADAIDVYAAIRLAEPGGLGRVDEQDVTAAPTQSLHAVMALAADRDTIAQQYVNDFSDVFTFGVPTLERAVRERRCFEEAIVLCHLEWMSRFPDSLVARKRGPVEAHEAAERARAVLATGWPDTDAGCAGLAELDRWLRAKGNPRNPGTSADLVTASLFAAFRDGTMKLPLRFSSAPIQFDVLTPENQ